MAKRSMCVGMDVHNESIDISVAEDGRHGEVRRYGVIAGDLEALAKVVRATRSMTPSAASSVAHGPTPTADAAIRGRRRGSPKSQVTGNRLGRARDFAGSGAFLSRSG